MATLLDKIHLQKYIYLIKQFIDGHVKADEFETTFLQVRRNDNYWMSGSFSEDINQTLDTFFLDVDEYTSENLFEDDAKYEINETELKKRAFKTLNSLIDTI
jgi:hypothetical protein